MKSSISDIYRTCPQPGHVIKTCPLVFPTLISPLCRHYDAIMTRLCTLIQTRTGTAAFAGLCNIHFCYRLIGVLDRIWTCISGLGNLGTNPLYHEDIGAPDRIWTCIFISLMHIAGRNRSHDGSKRLFNFQRPYAKLTTQSRMNAKSPKAKFAFGLFQLPCYLWVDDGG